MVDVYAKVDGKLRAYAAQTLDHIEAIRAVEHLLVDTDRANRGAVVALLQGGRSDSYPPLHDAA